MNLTVVIFYLFIRKFFPNMKSIYSVVSSCRLKAVASKLSRHYWFQYKNRSKILIEITKSEAQHLRELFHGIHIAKTKHKRYVSEELRYLRALPDNAEARAIVKNTNKLNRR